MDYQEKCINENSEARDDILEVNQQVQDKAEPLLE